MKEAARLTAKLILAPQAVSNGATVTANIDTQGLGGRLDAKAEHVTLIVNTAAEVNTNGVSPTVSLKESDDTVVTNFATITADINPDCTAAGSIRYEVPLNGRKRYLRLSIGVPTATNDNQTVSANALIKVKEEPANTTDMIFPATANLGTVIL